MSIRLRPVFVPSSAVSLPYIHARRSAHETLATPPRVLSALSTTAHYIIHRRNTTMHSYVFASMHQMSVIQQHINMRFFVHRRLNTTRWRCANQAPVVRLQFMAAGRLQVYRSVFCILNNHKTHILALGHLLQCAIHAYRRFWFKHQRIVRVTLHKSSFFLSPLTSTYQFIRKHHLQESSTIAKYNKEERFCMPRANYTDKEKNATYSACEDDVPIHAPQCVSFYTAPHLE